MKYLLTLLLMYSCHVDKPVVCKYVVDGDTFVTTTGEHIRIAGIDCPELGQPYGLQAKEFTEGLILDEELLLYDKGKDEYGRTVAFVRVYSNYSFSVEEMLVNNGLAWCYRSLSPKDLYYMEQTARSHHIGLWADPHPIPPFKYRQNDKQRN